MERFRVTTLSSTWPLDLIDLSGRSACAIHLLSRSSRELIACSSMTSAKALGKKLTMASPDRTTAGIPAKARVHRRTQTFAIRFFSMDTDQVRLPAAQL